MRFSFPDDVRPPSVEQRQQFYREEFDIKYVRDLYYRWSKPVFAIDVGTETTRYRPKYKKYKGKIVFIREYDDLEHLHEKLVSYAPEDLYYDLRTYDRDPRQTNAVWERPTGKQLVFDLDPELVECDHCERKRRHMGDETAAEMSFCEDCFTETAEATAKLKVFLDRHFNRVEPYFSGRGFHVQVKDDSGFEMKDEERRQLASKLAQRFPLDEKITAGEKQIFRLPGSLHGATGRKVVAVSVEELRDPLDILYEKSVPEVLS